MEEVKSLMTWATQVALVQLSAFGLFSLDSVDTASDGNIWKDKADYIYDMVSYFESHGYLGAIRLISVM
jgi:hypothetical protein